MKSASGKAFLAIWLLLALSGFASHVWAAKYYAIVDAGSSYVCRLRDNCQYTVIEERPLTPQDVAAGVISDEIVLFNTDHHPERVGPNHPIRLVRISCSPHTRRGKVGGSTGPSSDGILRLATNMTDVPAEIISLTYAHRWTIEIFFRFFKHVLGCRHLISHNQNGIEIQTYCAIIACLLISLWTGRKPSLRTYEMICYYFCGLASLEELERHISKLPGQSATIKND